jgi:AraC-like DNA-binding protein
MAGPARTLVATLLDPTERPRLDVAAEGRFATVHANTLPETLRTVRRNRVSAVLVSPSRIAREQLPGVARLVRGFPGIPTVAVLSRHDAVASERLLELGACGVRRMIDLGAREGWVRLRELLARPTGVTESLILSRVAPALGDAAVECRRFFEVLVRLAPGVTTVRSLARRVGVGASTFMSRFFRAGMPSPKRYLSAVRLVYAAGLLESPGLSVADVAYRLEYSSPQSFGRHLRTVLGVTAGEFRQRYPFDAALDDFIARLIVPFRPGFRTFRPLQNGVGDLGLGL